ncbi:MAG: TRAP transporter small permease [Lachnospiraceae bacterium]|nr:TRAP transporter small permease [Lachnospiraceae bacterium]
MRTLVKILDKFEEAVLVIGMFFMSIMNFINVFSRYLLANSFSFTEELTMIVFVWMTMLGIAVGFKRYAHLGMSFVSDHVPGKARAIMALFWTTCSFIAIAVMIKYGITMCQGLIKLGARTPALNIPSTTQGLAIPVGGVFICIRILQAGILEIIKYWNEDKTKTAEVAK